MPRESETTEWQEYFATLRAVDNPHRPGPPHLERLVPDVDLPVSETAVYRTVAITRVPSGTGTPVEITAALDPLTAPTGGATTPAEGVLLTHEQAWRVRGLALGRLLHSTSLAPGEVTQVAMSGWERTTSGSSAEGVEADESTSRAADRSRATHDVTSSVASENRSGGSSSSTFASQTDAGIGGALGFLGGSMSGSASFGVASTVGYNLGSRDLAADSTQSVRESTQQQASDSRGQRATLVQEVSQSETEQFTTRVVANYNHMHALTMMYFEVLQVYELSTRVTDAQRCLFLPMAPVEFDGPEVVSRFAVPLARAALAMGLPALAEGITQLGESGEFGPARLRTLEAASLVAEAARDEASTRYYEASTKLDEGRSELARLQAAAADVRGRADAAREQLAARSASQLSGIEAFPDGPARVVEIVRRTGEITDAVTHHAQLEVQAAAAQREVQLQAGITLPTLVAAVAGTSAEHLAATERSVDAQVRLITAQEVTMHRAADVVAQVDDRRLAFNQALWMQLDPGQVAAMLSGRRHRGVSLVETVDPAPVAVTGNYVGFRWSFPVGQEARAAEFRARHLSDDDVEAPAETVVLPTGGVFAEAVLGRANSAEELDLTRFWRWDDTTIPILPTAIARLHQERRAQAAEARPGGLGDPAVSLSALPTAPPGPSHTLASMIGTSLFRDMSGSDVVEGLLTTAQQAAASGSAAAQQAAHDNISAYLDHLEELLPQVAGAVKKQAGKVKDAAGKKDGGGLDPSVLGSLQNALGKEGAGLDVEGLLGTAAELGIFL